MYPSPAAFAIGLGPTDPSMISIAKETLFFRRARISLALRLLVPTFSLPYAPPWVTPSASSQNGTFSYHIARLATCGIRVFGTMLSPDHLRREISKSVSCYAFFEWWLLLSQHPDCLRNLTSSLALSIDLGTLDGDLGCFPFDEWSFAPIV